ncbi:hypothetical protein EYF80_035395 [Liparis tanakae]|uniref:Uncharacterized protein n=1 Tax=Liparis tanakae TaxID=230148 RepID=A0A4Z2GLF8_9TELE|nr:hypothetical protein EYF80_035395 [Liparis tanakae]
MIRVEHIEGDALGPWRPRLRFGERQRRRALNCRNSSPRRFPREVRRTGLLKLGSRRLRRERVAGERWKQSSKSSPLVVGEVVVDVGGEHTGVLRIELQHLSQTAHVDVLEVAVGQRLHVGVGFDHLVGSRQGPGADKVVGVQRVTLTDEVLPGDAEGGFYVERQRAQAAATGPLKNRQLEDVLIQMHGDVSPQLIGEVVEELRTGDRCNKVKMTQTFVEGRQRAARPEGRQDGDSYLVGVDPVVDGPRGLEVLQHALLDLLGQPVDADEVLQHWRAKAPEGECAPVSDVPPMSMVQMENIFSASVLAQTLPKPTLVRLLRVALREASSDSPMSQVSLVSISLRPIMYQMQAIQCASRANTDMSKVSTMALY